MTADLNRLIDLRNNQIIKDANVQAAEDIGKMAELGYFPVEFTMYGCAYLNPIDNKMYYKISSEAEKIYDFIERSMLNKIYASNVLSLTKKIPVPSGMKEFIAQDVKYDLAKKLKKEFPKEFFTLLYNQAGKCRNDLAADILWQETRELEGLFDEEKLERFEEMMQYAYTCCSISETTYEKLQSWLKEERKNMEQDFISKDIFEKTLYAFAYLDNGKISYMINTQKDYIYEKAYSLEQEQVFVTPIFHKTFWYNYEYRLADVKKDFKKMVSNELTEDYLEKVRKIKGEKTSNLTIGALTKYGTNCVDTLSRYYFRWGIVSNNVENIEV